MDEIPADWDLITAGDGRHRARVPHPDGGWGWRAPCSNKIETEAEILALGRLRRAVVLTLPNLISVWARSEVRESNPGLVKMSAADLYAAALEAERPKEREITDQQALAIFNAVADLPEEDDPPVCSCPPAWSLADLQDVEPDCPIHGGLP